MQPKVSIIIPIYGVELYIERCARSLFEQTLDDMEYIFIDDCTPDNSVHILENVLSEYPNRKSQTKIIRMPTNSGVAAVRRHGIQLVKGKYIIHCDSDDWVEPNMYEDMYNAAISKNFDITICDYYESLSIIKHNHISQIIPYNIDLLIRGLILGKIHGSLCNKLVKRELYLKKIIYPQYNMQEDLTILLQLMNHAKSVIHIQRPYYHYYVNHNSITRSDDFYNILKKGNDAINNYRIIETIFKGTHNNELNNLKLRIKNSCAIISGSKKGYKEWKQIFPELSLRDIISKHLSFKDLVIYILANMRLFDKVKKITSLK